MVLVSGSPTRWRPKGRHGNRANSLIKYLGSKRVLVPTIVELVGCLENTKTVVDLFSGTARVGRALKAAGFHVTANDHNRYAHALATCYVQADRNKLERVALSYINKYNRLEARDGWFTEIYCREARYFQAKNGARIEAIRNAIAEAGHTKILEKVLLVSLMEAADRVDSTTGVQMAYLKSWAARSNNDLKLRLPELVPGPGNARCMDAELAARKLSADLVYLDPPYNQHSYLSNYHIWETLTTWDEPEVYGIARKRIDCRVRKSKFNSKPGILPAMEEVVRAIKARHLIVSFNDEGRISPQDMIALLSTKGEVLTLRFDYKRYVGAQIGIYNPQGKKVGAPGRLRNKEYLFVVAQDARSKKAIRKRFSHNLCRV